MKGRRESDDGWAELGGLIVETLRLHELLTWLDDRCPSWVARLPDPPPLIYWLAAGGVIGIVAGIALR